MSDLIHILIITAKSTYLILLRGLKSRMFRPPKADLWRLLLIHQGQSLSLADRMEAFCFGILGRGNEF